MKHLKVTNKFRFTISIIILFTIVFSVFTSITTKVFSHQEPVYTEITVSYGDTLWSIAKELDGKINENIYNIQKINNLKDCNIYEGQKLLIPEQK